MIEAAIQSALRDLVEQQEAYLLKFFGSKENAERFGHLYVFEEYAPEWAEVDGKYRMTQTYRLRLKTAEELAAEHERENSST